MRLLLPMQNVLIINKSEAIRQILVRIMRSADLAVGQIYQAADALEAIEALKQKVIGLILSDVDMPDMNGLQLLADIKQIERARDIPVVMISSDASKDTVLEALKLGAAGYISKPFTTEHIREKLIPLL
jgi:two-component system chemotaxis response regulator CheY